MPEHGTVEMHGGHRVSGRHISLSCDDKFIAREVSSCRRLAVSARRIKGDQMHNAIDAYRERTVAYRPSSYSTSASTANVLNVVYPCTTRQAMNKQRGDATQQPALAGQAHRNNMT
jgi:hypothetical protein